MQKSDPVFKEDQPMANFAFKEMKNTWKLMDGPLSTDKEVKSWQYLKLANSQGEFGAPKCNKFVSISKPPIIMLQAKNKSMFVYFYRDRSGWHLNGPHWYQ